MGVVAGLYVSVHEFKVFAPSAPIGTQVFIFINYIMTYG